jgi:CheY-like chemotaxis protein
MTQPLALVLHEKLLPGSQLVNRLHDLKYRVQVIADATALAKCAQQEKPMLVLVDLMSSRTEINPAIATLRQDPETKHIPIIAFAPESARIQRAAAQDAGATLVVSDTAILTHLSQLLDQALQIE